MAQSIYRQLSASRREIRLITILPSPNRSDPLACSLHVTTLPSSNPYRALSYVWGDLKTTTSLQVDGEQLQITPNLDVALRYIRDPSELRMFWIDAVCINQADIQERSQQVLLMGDIFQGAQFVVAWLGEERDDSNLALDLVDRFANA